MRAVVPSSQDLPPRGLLWLQKCEDPKSPESGAAADVGSQTGGPLVSATAAGDAGAGHCAAGCWVDLAWVFFWHGSG